MRHIYIIIGIGLAAVLAAGCEKIAFREVKESTPAMVFEELWGRVDQQYALFDVKGVDWDSVHDCYAPMVADERIGDDSLFGVLARMLGTLRDGHVNLVAPFDVSHSEEIFLQTYGRRNIDMQVVALNYLTAGYHSAGGFAYNTIRDGQVVYVRYSSFSNSAETALLDGITKRYPEAKGMILDIRQNGGGSVANLWKILALLPARHQLLYRTQIKSGPGHEDFSEVEEVYSAFTNDYGPYEKPVVVLTDRGSYSASSFFALCCKAYDNVTLVGDTTGGGLGLPNGGELSNGWTYRFPVTRTIAPDGKNYENGVPPDRVVLLDDAATAAGKDNVIEAAADIICGTL